MNIKEIITKAARGGGRKSVNRIGYSWITCGTNKLDGSERGALSIMFSGKLLEEMRFRDGDRVDVDIFKKEITFRLTTDTESPLLSRGNRKPIIGGEVNRTIRFSHKKAYEQLSPFFPNRGKHVALRVLSVSSQSVTVESPTKEGHTQ